MWWIAFAAGLVVFPMLTFAAVLLARIADLARPATPAELPQPLFANNPTDQSPVVRLDTVTDIPVCTILDGDPVGVAIWLNLVKEGVQIRA